MENHETIVLRIIPCDNPYELSPVFRHHVTGIYRRRELIDIYIYIFTDEIKLRHRVLKMIEIEWFQRTRPWILAHPYGSACVYQQYFVHNQILILYCRHPLDGDTDAD